MSRPAAGDLNRRVTILRLVKVDDGKGGLETSWDEVAIVRARVTGQDGREAVIGRALEGVSTYRILIRWKAAIQPQPEDQLLYDGRTLNIRSAYDPDGRREQMIILADTASAQPVT